MSDLDPTEQKLLQDAAARSVTPLDARERVAEIACGGTFVVGAILLALLAGPADCHPVAALVCTVGLMLALRVRFEVAGLYTVPTQLAFVPLLFTVAPAAVPWLVVLALVAVRLPAVLAGRTPASRLLLCLGNAWFALGAAIALMLVGGVEAVADRPELLMVVVAAQVAADFVASATREALVRGATLREQLADARWVYSVDVALTPVAFLGATTGGQSVWKPLALLPLLVLLRSFARERRERLESAVELTTAYRGIALVLGDVVEADDHYTGEHCKDVVDLAMRVGEQFDLSAWDLRNLEFGALLHDVGKVVVPKEIINKPGKLTDEEYEIVKTHAVEGQRMLDRVGGFMREVGVVVRHHHERWDGRGYPDAIAGEAIPLASRIIACCDTFNAITTTRSYRAAQTEAQAIAELRRCAGSQFDPAVVEALIKAIGGAERSPFVAGVAAAATQDAATPALLHRVS